MNFEIRNSKEDQYGNSKDNIFLAFDNSGNYLGSSYAYPAINHCQTYETPYTIFINVMVESNVDKPLSKEVRQKLFDKVYTRAKELRTERLDLKARIYSGFEYDDEKLDFYVTNGFDEDYSIIMEAEIQESFKFTLPENVSVLDCDIESEKAVTEYKTNYDKIFITPLDLDILREQGQYKHFKNLYFLIDGKLKGGCTIFEKEGVGYIETVYVLPEAMGKGISKIIVNYIFQYFLSMGLKKTRLEVWQLNNRAVELYKSFSYKEVKKNLMFPGITL